MKKTHEYRIYPTYEKKSLLVKHDLTLKDRECTCPECGEDHDRDVNAAINIRDYSFVNTGSDRNARKSKSVSYGNSLESSAERMFREDFRIPRPFRVVRSPKNNI